MEWGAGATPLSAEFWFPLDVLDEIWDVIESVSEGFLYPLLFSRIGLTFSCHLECSVKLYSK